MQNFAPKCYQCKTAIIEERFISLDDPALGKRTYHGPHFFCAECGDPFLTPSSSDFEKGEKRSGELALSGDGEFESDNVGFTVYRGHPYCESCHVRLRLPKCKRCKKSIRDGDRAVEALGGKWCWTCFVCEVRASPEPSFFFLFPDEYQMYRAARSHSKTLRFFSGQKNLIASLVSASCFGTKYKALASLWCRVMYEREVFLGHFYLSYLAWNSVCKCQDENSCKNYKVEAA